MENNLIIPNISQNILINFVPETEKLKVEKENEKILQISQCVYNYKDKIWRIIFQKEIMKKQKQFGRDNLKDILNSLFDEELTLQQLEHKNKIAENIKKKYPNINYFFNCLNIITFERNYVSHPKIDQSNINILRENFLNYCNEIWEDDEDLNKIFTEDIFVMLIY